MKVSRVVDLSHEFYEGMPAWLTETKLIRVTSVEKEGFNTSEFRVHTHTGTHLDPPAQYIPDGKMVEQVPLTSLIGEGVVVDCTHAGEKHGITVDDVRRSVDKNLEGRFILLHTNFDRLWGSPKYFSSSPYLTGEVVNWFVDRRVKAVGVDFLDVDLQQPAEFGRVTIAHRTLCQNNISIFENLTGLGELRSENFLVVALPLKIRGADGGPARVVAVEFE